MDHAKLFFDTYLPSAQELTIVDLGAQDVNGSLRSVAPQGCKYVGVDFEAGKGVDVVITDPYSLPFEDGSVDAIVSSSCYEHSEFFWLSFLEALRILQPAGLFYLNVPSNGAFHRYPVDCWRFYPDSGIALQNWGRRNGYAVTLLESFVGKQQGLGWNDFVAVFVKDGQNAAQHPRRIQAVTRDYSNGRAAGTDEIANFALLPEDQMTLCHRLRRKGRGYLAALSRRLGG